jgi:hypothetical protein
MRRKTVLFVLAALLLTAPWASAAPRHGTGGPVTAFGIGIPEVLDQAWQRLIEIWRKTGCNIDPDGRCATSATPASSADSGCHIDPNGQCQTSAAPVSSADTGCQIDPFGRCGS